MERYPREEISYKKIYRKVDLGAPLGAPWAAGGDSPARPGLHLGATENSSEAPHFLDSHDRAFCQAADISEGEFLRVYAQLESEYKRQMLAKLREIEPVKPTGACDICGGPESEDQALLACNICGISVHPDCYGIQNAEDEYWVCTECLITTSRAHCSYCPKRDGILKPTNSNRWIHPVCAILHPDISFENDKYKEPVDVSLLARGRKGPCGICAEVSPWLISCAYSGCASRYHASCAAESLFCDLNNGIVYCPKHDPNSTGNELIVRRRLAMHRASYPDLDHEIFMRIPMKLSERTETPLGRALGACPGELVGEECVGDERGKQVRAYWVEEKRAYRNRLTDPYLFIDWINKRYPDGTCDQRT